MNVESNKGVHLEGLNGLRAIAAISVVVGHTTSFYSFKFFLPAVHVGFDGVTLFFVISGFLITYLLLLEKEKTGTISVKRFYLRRILRIWPIYYLIFFVSFILSLNFSELGNFKTKESLYYLFFAANIPFIFTSGIQSVVHYWSIGVEEQFYLLWPVFVKLLKKLNLKTIAIIIVLLIIIFFVIKATIWFFLGNSNFLYRFLAVTRIHCMLIGALGALLFMYKSKILYFLKYWWMQAICWGVVLLMLFNVLVLPALLNAEFTAVLSLCLILSQVNKFPKIINFENRVFDFLGKISYGIYVIHLLVIFCFTLLYKHLHFSVLWQVIIVYSSVIFTTIIISYISYCYYEKPFLKLKNKFAVIKSISSNYEK
jgi:peptidoglycan/LPS O-acetylase OafA/YrhL